MMLKNLKLYNFRNYDDLEIDLSPNINIFIGDNGAGKTNILESVYVLSLTKSTRFGNFSDLIKIDKTNSKVIGEVLHDDYIKKYQIELNKFEKKVYINSREIKKITDYISNFCVTTFLPNDIEIIKGSPNIRRNLLNIQIGQIYNNYLMHLNEYNNILKIRNEYLKRISINGMADKKYLEIVNQKMIEISLKIYYFRYFYMEEINKIISNIFKKLSNIDGLSIEYVNNLNLLKYDEEYIKKYLLDKYNKNFNKELMQGSTIFGLHRDDLIFKINGSDSRIYASEGQQRLIVIAYKISELMLFKKIKGEYPVLLLDDVFSEIDIKKRNNLIKFLKKDIQVILTTTDINDINEELVNDAKIFTIKKGNIKIKGGAKNGRRKSTSKL